MAWPRRGGHLRPPDGAPRRWRPPMAAWWWSPRPVTGAAGRPSHPRDNRRGGHLAGAGYPGGPGLLLGYHVRRPGRCVEHRASSGGQSIGARVQTADDDFTAIELTFGRGSSIGRATPPSPSTWSIPGDRHSRSAHRFQPGRIPGVGLRDAGRAGWQRAGGAAAGLHAERPGQRHERGRAAGWRRAAQRPARRPARLLRLRLGGATRRLRQQDDEPGRPRHACPAAHPRLGRRSGVGRAGDQAAAPRSAGAPGPDRGRLPGQRPAQRGRGRDLEARRVRGHLQPRDRRDPGALRRRRLRDPS